MTIEATSKAPPVRQFSRPTRELRVVLLEGVHDTAIDFRALVTIERPRSKPVAHGWALSLAKSRVNIRR